MRSHNQSKEVTKARSTAPLLVWLSIPPQPTMNQRNVDVDKFCFCVQRGNKGKRLLTIGIAYLS